MGEMVKVNWWGHFSVYPKVPISFSLAIWPDYSIYNVPVRGSPFLCTASLLPSQPKPVPTYTHESKGASKSIFCSRTQRGTQGARTHDLGIMSPEFYSEVSASLPEMRSDNLYGNRQLTLEIRK